MAILEHRLPAFLAFNRISSILLRACYPWENVLALRTLLLTLVSPYLEALSSGRSPPPSAFRVISTRTSGFVFFLFFSFLFFLSQTSREGCVCGLRNFSDARTEFAAFHLPLIRVSSRLTVNPEDSCETRRFEKNAREKNGLRYFSCIPPLRYGLCRCAQESVDEYSSGVPFEKDRRWKIGIVLHARFPRAVRTTIPWSVRSSRAW